MEDEAHSCVAVDSGVALVLGDGGAVVIISIIAALASEVAVVTGQVPHLSVHPLLTTKNSGKNG